MRGVAIVLVVVAITAPGACNRPGPRPTGGQWAAGEAVYAQHCLSCHHAEDEDGPILSRKALSSYDRADSLFTYIRENMPYKTKYRLTFRQYLDVTAYLLQRYEFVDGTQALTHEALDEIRLDR